MKRKPPKLVHERGKFYFVWPDGFREEAAPLFATNWNLENGEATSGFVVWHTLRGD